MENNKSVTAVEWLVTELYEKMEMKGDGKVFNKIFNKAKEIERQQQGYSEEEVLPLLEIIQKCKEYFLLKTDNYSDERADAIIDVMENFKKK